MTPDFQRWKLLLAYDGRPYQGWQSQPGGNTIQDHLERALAKILLTERVVVHGAGRTDAGVHARAQVAHFDAPLDWRMKPDQWLRAFNVCLPATIRVKEAERVGSEFHARFSAIAKSYFYKIDTNLVLDPLQAGLAWHLHNSLQENDVLTALSWLKGTHDFRAFAVNRGKNQPPVESTVRTIYQAELSRPTENEWVISFLGNGFLYKMVRMMVGTIVRFAQGRLEKSDFLKLLNDPPTLKTSACAPADGLYLSGVDYGE